MYYHLLYVTASLRVGGEPVTFGDHVLVVGDAAGKHSIFPHFVLIGASQRKSHTSMTAFSMCMCIYVCLDQPLTNEYNQVFRKDWYHVPVESNYQNVMSLATRKEDNWSWTIQAACVCVCFNYGLWQANFTTGYYLRTVMRHCGWSCFRYWLCSRGSTHNLFSSRMSLPWLTADSHEP